MLRRNVITIVIASLVMIFTSQVFGLEKPRKVKGKQPSGILTETGIPFKAKPNSSQSKSKRRGRWEGPEYDALKDNLRMKPKQARNRLSKPSNRHGKSAKVEPKMIHKPTVKSPKTSGYIGETEKNVAAPAGAQKTSKRNKNEKQSGYRSGT
ncbi:MAG: hypothetical protein HY231_15360 [Acidobacteria bacterium]|nr:hypothetical protein [Acidobacteriota bacterium]